MKSITIDFYGNEADYILLENVDDVIEYNETILQRDAGIAAQRMLKTSLKPDQFDHLITQDGPGGIIAAAYSKAKFVASSPLLEVGITSDSKIARMLSHAAQGEQIMINEVGGYCFRTPETKILREGPYSPFEHATYVIKENTKYINLENDAVLEDHTIKHLRKVDKFYSYITNLRSFSKEDLVKVFNEFKANGGEAAYLYTTGFDVDQVHEYCEALQEAGITKIDFEFNSGITVKLQEALDTIAENMSISVKEV